MSLEIDSEEDEQRRKREWESIVQVVAATTAATSAAVVASESLFSMEESMRGPTVDHRKLPRSNRRRFRHDHALMCIKRDYLGQSPLFPGSQFVKHFRITPARFNRIMDEVANSDIKYYTNRLDATGEEGASLEARLLLPLKTIAYGVPPHCFQDYFQMSDTMARRAMKEFDSMMKKLYKEEYLRVPTKADMKSIVKLHEAIHKIKGHFLSVDCMHTPWKNCPVAWQGSYEGKEGLPTLVLEGGCDYHLWFWSACFGFAGTLNDRTILSLSELFEKLIDGTIVELEEELVPYEISNEKFNKLFILVDGIYPQWSRFVKGMKEPVWPAEVKFTKWQEAARKDIERAFGVLQQKFQFMSRPIQLMDLNAISDRVTTCLILHNMCVSDRVMGDVYARYDPAFSVEKRKKNAIRVSQPDDLDMFQEKYSDECDEPGILSKIGFDGLNGEEKAAITRRYLLNDLRDTAEHVRLTKAIMVEKLRQSNVRYSK